MKELGNIIRISENTPLIMIPLVDILKYNGITHYFYQLLLGTAPDIPSLDLHTKKYLKESQATRKIPPLQSHSYLSNIIQKIVQKADISQLIWTLGHKPIHGKN